ncbi:hypothetical protein PVAND_002308 [Polypedilum vanderplanki]|uniref:CRAL-TRIO domain-containing protein n=1 Tax=Polypedilum vanderplanki TaxID=319348 RepID=A0A9J6BRS7_POLVA|nr:hypothetical protein PVAND_002308 [Polypedilum vanderplanki]
MAKIRPLSPALQEKAIKELFEVPERIEQDLETFRQWITKSKHIKGRTDDQFLIAFLRGCKYSMEKAKQKYDLFYTLKTHIPELCKNRDPADEKVLATIRQGVGVLLPNTDTPDGPRYLLIRPGAYDPTKFTITDVMKTAMMSIEAHMQHDDNYLIGGVIGILDFTHVTVNHFMQFTPGFIKKVSMLQQDAAPIRQKGSHFVKMPAIALTVFNIFKSFTNEKNRQRIYVHGDDMEELFKVIPKKLLPEEYGGDAGPLKDIIAENEKVIMSYRDYFLEDEQYGVDEKKRIGKAQNPESLFGIDGLKKKVIKMLDIRPLNEELQEVARTQLNENPEEIEENMRKFKEMITKSSHLRARINDQFLIAFLRASKYDLDKALRHLDIFYTLRAKIPDLIKDRAPTNHTLRQIIKLGFGIPLPNTLSAGGSRYLLIRPGAVDATKYTLRDVIKVCTLINDIQINCDDNWIISGQVEVIDLANVTRHHLMQLEPILIKRMTLLFQEAYPVKSIGFHYINTPFGFESIFSVFLSCMNEENRSRVFMHGSDMESLYKVVPRRLMPADYGGSAATIKEIINDWEEKIFSYRQYFEEEEEQFGVDESKRSPDAFNPNTIFNVDEAEGEIDYSISPCVSLTRGLVILSYKREKNKLPR